MDLSLLRKIAGFAYQIYKIEQKYGVISKLLPVIFDAIKAVSKTEADTTQYSAPEKQIYCKQLLSDNNLNTLENTEELINLIHEVAAKDKNSNVHSNKYNHKPEVK